MSKYLESDFFCGEIERMNTFIRDNRYNIISEDRFVKTVAEIVREEFCSGSRRLIRGFYNPDPIEDIVVEGVRRGKILQRVTSRSKPNYVYGFDSSDRLILSQEITEFGIIPEIIIRTDETENGYTEIGLRYELNRFREEKKMDCITHIIEAKYENGKPVCVSVFTMSPLALDGVIEVDRREYCYSENETAADWYSYSKNGTVAEKEEWEQFPVSNICLQPEVLLSHCGYRLKYADDGTLDVDFCLEYV